MPVGCGIKDSSSHPLDRSQPVNQTVRVSTTGALGAASTRTNTGAMPLVFTNTPWQYTPPRRTTAFVGRAPRFDSWPYWSAPLGVAGPRHTLPPKVVT